MKYIDSSNLHKVMESYSYTYDKNDNIKSKTTVNNYPKKDSDKINETKKYLKNISYDRKKRELDKIFASIHAKEGINLLKELDLLEFLDLENIDRVKDYSDLIGIWSMINSQVYPFTKNEKELIKNINFVYELDNLTWYKDKP